MSSSNGTPTPDDARRAFESGAVYQEPDEVLRGYLLALTGNRILDEANRFMAAGRIETLRQILSDRAAKRLHGEALAVARASKWLAAAALVIAVVQLIASAPDWLPKWHCLVARIPCPGSSD